jgi:pimeloyl-ACP methyl ester carboxylesterase
VHLHGQTLQYADSNSVKIAYEVLGASGPNIIAIGVSNCPAVRTRSRITSQRWDAFARYCRVILYDRRGVGFSAAPEHGYSVLASTEDVRAVLEAAGAEQAILWGATDGGPLAIAFAAHYPERVAGLLLLGTTAKYTSSEDFPWGMNQEALEAFVRTDPIDRGRAVAQLTRTRAARHDPGSGPGAISEVMRRVPRHVWSKIVAGIGAADVRSLLDRIVVPTMIVHDPDNAYISVDAARYLHEHIPGSHLVISEEWGKPLLGDELHRTIRSFIDDVTRGDGPP